MASNWNLTEKNRAYLNEKIKNNPLGFVQLLLYALTVFFGFCVAIPADQTIRNFDGSCPFGAQIVWNNKVIWPWMETYCDFAEYYNIGMNIVYALFMTIFFGFAVWPRTFKQPSRTGQSQDWNLKFVLQSINPIFLTVNLVALGLALCSAIVATVGMRRFCTYLMESLEEDGRSIKHCSEGQGLDDYWHHLRIRGGKSQGVLGHWFYTHMMMIVVCSWILVIIWLIQLCANFSLVCRRCSCEIAEEKRNKMDKATLIAQRRSRLATPMSMTPRGVPGSQTPVPMDQPSVQFNMGRPNPAYQGNVGLPPKPGMRDDYY